MRRIPVKDWLIHDASTASGVGKVFAVSDFRHITIAIKTSGNTDATFKVQGAVGERTVDFSDGIDSNNGTVANPWMYVQVIDLQDASALDGDTGVVYSGTDSIRLVEVNTNSLDFINVHISAFIAGTMSVVAHASSNM